MANITKVSPYRSGTPRFGLKSQPFDNTVKISYLTPEELEEYRSGKRGGSKMLTYDDYLEMIADGKSNKEIAKEMNISVATLYNRIKAWKETPQKNAQKATEIEKEVSETHNTTKDKNDEYKSIIAELKAQMESSSAAKDVIIEGLEKKVDYWKGLAEKHDSQQVAELQAALNDSQDQFKQTTIEKNNLTIKVLNLEHELRQMDKLHQELQTKHNELLEDYYTLKEEITPLRQLTLLKLRNDIGVLHEKH